jgi:hypothetical protein
MKLEQIEKVIEQIRFLPNSQVDCGTEQGQKQFFAQLSEHIATPEMLKVPFNCYVLETNKCLVQIEKIIRPYSLPTDFLSFLKIYGGLTIANEDSHFATLGFGPMSEDWYPNLLGNVGYYENGFLKIGTLRFRDPVEYKFMYVFFFLDLGNRIQRNRVIGVSMWKLRELNLQDVLREPQSCSFCWSRIADSFTEWLQTAANTKGRFEHLQI